MSIFEGPRVRYIPLRICCLLLFAILADVAQPARAQDTIPTATFLPLFSTNSSSKSTSEPNAAVAVEDGALLEGIISSDATGQYQLEDPWGHRHRIVGSTIIENSIEQHLAATHINGKYVLLTGRWRDDALGPVFVTQTARALDVDPIPYAAYVAREMSDPALRKSLPQTLGETQRGLQTLPQDLSPPDAGGAGGGHREPEGATATAINANPADVGEWSDVQDIGMYALHAVMRPDGKVMFWYRTYITDVNDPVYNTVLWDPITKEVISVPNYSLNTDENWCAAHSQLGDGRLFAATGYVGSADPHSDILDYTTNHWTKIPDLNFGRYYPSSTFMADGRVVISGGDYINPDTGNVDNPFPEVWEDGAWRIFDEPLETKPTQIEYDFYYGSFYPWTQQAPNGQIFYAGPQSELRYLDPDEPTSSGTGSVREVAERDNKSRDYGSYATYDIGKVLIAGGGDSLRTAYTIDYDVNEQNIDDKTPTVEQTGSLNIGRRNFYTTILADGSVLATGGNKDGGITQASASGAVYKAELWDPETGDWTLMAATEKRREYHSSAVLLPDARVVHAGGDCTPCDPQTNLEVFSPPYLFNADGSDATRPVITGAPQDIDYGQHFSVDFSQADAIAKVNLIRLGSSTHSTNFDQRLIPLNFTASDHTLTVTGPKNAYIAPPGFYMLFLISEDGVPSMAEMVKVGTHIDRLTPLYGPSNGGFESDPQGAENNIVYVQAGDNIGAWAVEAGDVDVHHNTYLDAGVGAEGDQHLDLHGIEAGQISQQITDLTPGERYVLEFIYRAHPYTDWAAATVEINDNASASPHVDGDGGNTKRAESITESWSVSGAAAKTWQTKRIEFVASSSSTILRFRGDDRLTYAGMLLDDIKVIAYRDDQPAPDTGRAPVNLALNQSTSQSSLYAGSADLAVDGNNLGNGQDNQVARTDKEYEPWWQVDLGHNEAIDHVVIWPQSDCCPHLLHHVYILVSESDLTGRALGDILADPTVMRAYIADPVEAPLTKILRGSGRYMRIQSAIPSSLSLAEVQVFGPPPPNRVPVISGPGAHIAQIGQPSSLTVEASDPDGHTLTLGAANLPAGLAMNPANGVISGTLSTSGIYSLTVTAEDNYGGSAESTIPWIVNEPPTIGELGVQRVTVGVPFSQSIDIYDVDGNELTVSVDGLPAGIELVQLDSVFTITGTVELPNAPNAEQILSTITAADDRGGSTAVDVAWEINGRPAVTRPGNQRSNPHESTVLKLEGSDPDGDSLYYQAADLPTGLTIVPASGLITGTATTSGIYSVTVQVDDRAGGVAEIAFSWRINSPPVMLQPESQSHFDGVAVSLELKATDADNDPLLYSAAGLPPSVSLSADTGLISGRLDGAGRYTATATVTDSSGLTDTVTFSWQVQERTNAQPTIQNPGSQTQVVGDSVSLPIQARDDEGDALTFSADGLPVGLRIGSASGFISGTLSANGLFTVTVAANDGHNDPAKVKFIWLVEQQPTPPNRAPVLTQPEAVQSKAGEPFTLMLNAQDPDGDDLHFAAQGLPDGLTLNAEAGRISGAPKKAGTYEVIITVGDGKGEQQQISFTLTVLPIDEEEPDKTPVEGEEGAEFQIFLPVNM